MKQNKTIEETLKERGAVYGDYKGGSELRASILEIIENRHLEVTGRPMKPVDSIYIFDIVNKLSRLSVTPNHLDTWHDIAGYAKLVEDTLIAEKQEILRQRKRDMEKDCE